MKTKFIFTALFIVFSFTVFSQTINVLKDKRDGKNYNITKIGDQIWISENLKYVTNSGSYCYNDSIDNCNKYGRLYTWEAAKQACPAGWHLPDEQEWTTLINYLGGNEVAGGKLKSTTGWNKPDSVSKIQCGHTTHKDGALGSHDSIATNSSGFTALPSGGKYLNSTFDYSKAYSLLWSSTEYNVTQAWYFYLYYNVAEVQKYYSIKLNGFSVRCVKN